MRLKTLLLAMVALPGAALAQTTAITPDVGAALGLGTTAAQAGKIVTIDGGTLAGGNLFHSFAQFNLGAGDTAQWVRAGGGAAGVSNVINRVTGGQVSQIAGRIDSSGLPNASFFFINPAGVVFGAGAQVNVPGAAYFSTAGELRFAGGAKFAVATPNGSTLSVAAPESFGFLGGQGAISVRDAAEGFAGPSMTLSLSGSSVGVSGAKFALRGLDLVGVGGGASVVTLADSASVARAGAVNVSASQVLVSAGGALRIAGGAVTLDGGFLVADSTGPGRGADVRIAADQLRLVNAPLVASSEHGAGAGGDIVITARTIDGDGGVFSTLTDGAGAGGKLSFTADTINLANATLGSNGLGTGTGGSIAVTAKSLTFDSVNVVANAIGVGKGGDVTVTAPRMDIGAGVIFTTAGGTGDPGDVVLKGDRISINGGSFGSAPGFGAGAGSLSITADTSLDVLGGFFSAVAYGDFSSGTMTINAPTIIFENAFFDIESLGLAATGVLDIQGKSIIFEDSRINAPSRGEASNRSGFVHIKATGDLLLHLGAIDSTAYDATNGGTIFLEGGRITLDGIEVGANSAGYGQGGQVNVKADTLKLINNSKLTSQSQVAGDAGDVTIEANLITLDQESLISSETFSLEGNAGKVTIKGGKLTLNGNSQITSSADGGFGRAGKVTVNVDSLSLTDSEVSSDARSLGDGGDVTISVTGDLQILGNRRPFTSISSNTFSSGNAGAVTITAKTMTVRDQGFVSSEALEGSDGNAGKVSITAGTLVLLNGGYVQSDSSGAGGAGDVMVKADTLTIDGSGDDNAATFISSDAFNGGDAGKVIIDAAGTLSIVHAGFVSSDTFTGANAGDITITAKTLILRDFGAVVSQAFPGSFGDAGKISITADNVSISDNSLVSTSSFGQGNAGGVTINAKLGLNVDFSRISSSAETGARGASGTLKITAGALLLTNTGIIETVSNNTLKAGQIDITADSIVIDGKDSTISSENQAGNVALGNRRGQSGAAGGITIAANDITVSEGGVVSTNSFAGAAGEIRITMPPMTLLTLEGVKLPGAIQTSSGAGTGGKIIISAPLAIVSNGGSILALGERRGANVVIESRYLINSSDRTNIVAVDGEFKLVAGVYDVSAGTVNRDLSVLDASKVLRGQCPVARSTGQVSQLITRQVGPYVREPAFEPIQRPVARPSLGVIGACF